MIELYRRALNLAERLIAEEVGDLWEDWMRHVDDVLDDPELLDLVYTTLATRWPNSRTRGRKGTPAEVVLRLLVLKHMRNWSYAMVEREVRANLVYRQFTRVGTQKVPDAKMPDLTTGNGGSTAKHRGRRSGSDRQGSRDHPQQALVRDHRDARACRRRCRGEHDHES